jgi:protein-S-isoprenylcysteine O-methyltransferase Ste14
MASPTGHGGAPNRWPWPPLVFGAAAAAAIVLGWVIPLPASEAGWTGSVGIAVMMTGIALDVWAIWTMRRADTNIMPNRAADRLVTWGPFRLSRNPIYSGNTILLIGIGIAFARSWFVVMALLAAALVDRLAIRREERHLAEKFGPAWTDYAARTPRWLIVLSRGTPRRL